MFVEDILYPVIALWKLEKPTVRKAPAGAFRYFRGKYKGGGKMKKKGFLTYDEQIAFLKEEKNLEIQDEELLKRYCLKQDISR